MGYSMDCPVENCEHVMKTEAENEDLAVAELMKSGNEHFSEAEHVMDQSMTAEMQEMMTRKFMKKLLPEASK